MSIFPSQSFTQDNVKFRWEERYTSEGINKKFLGIPRGVYAGFVPTTTTMSLILTLAVDVSEGFSLARVVSGQEHAMVDIITESPVLLDFNGHTTWPVYVIASASYQVGSETSGTIFSRATPASGPTEVNICKVDRPGNTGDLIVTPNSTQVFPTTDISARQEPYAFQGQRFGFMPDGSKEKLDTAFLTSQEVVASRQDTTVEISPTFDPLFPQTTGLPRRLSRDLSGASMASRLGLTTKTVRSISYSLPGAAVDITVASSAGFTVGSEVTGSVGAPIGRIRAINGNIITVMTLANTFTASGTLTQTAGPSSAISLVVTNYLNLTGSLSAKRRASPGVVFPVADTSSTTIVGTDQPLAINPGGTEDPNIGITAPHPPIEGAIVQTTIPIIILTVSSVIGTFRSGAKITGLTSGAVAIVGNYNAPYLTVTPVSGTFVVETIQNDITIFTLASASVTTVSSGVISDTTRNIAIINKTDTGERLSDSTGNTIFGRLDFTTQDVLTGTFDFALGFNTVNTSADQRTLLDIGDTVLAPDGRWYEVTGINPSIATQITIHQNYLGTTSIGTPNVIRRRVKLNFRSRPIATGLEGVASVSGSTTTQMFFPTWFSEEKSDFDAGLMMEATGPATIADATQTLKGKVLLAPGPGGASDANSMKVGMIAKVQTASVDVGPGNYHTINFLAGTAAPGGPGIINITSTGASGSPGTPGGSVVGPPGAGFTTFAAQYFGTVDSGVFPAASIGTTPISGTFSFIPKMYAVLSTTDNGAGGFPNLTDEIFIAGGGGLSPVTNPVSGTITITVSGRSFDGATTSVMHIWVTAAG